MRRNVRGAGGGGGAATSPIAKAGAASRSRHARDKASSSSSAAAVAVNNSNSNSHSHSNASPPTAPVGNGGGGGGGGCGGSLTSVPSVTATSSAVHASTSANNNTTTAMSGAGATTTAATTSSSSRAGSGAMHHARRTGAAAAAAAAAAATMLQHRDNSTSNESSALLATAAAATTATTTAPPEHATATATPPAATTTTTTTTAGSGRSLDSLGKRTDAQLSEIQQRLRQMHDDIKKIDTTSTRLSEVVVSAITSGGSSGSAAAGNTTTTAQTPPLVPTPTSTSRGASATEARASDGSRNNTNSGNGGGTTKLPPVVVNNNNSHNLSSSSSAAEATAGRRGYGNNTAASHHLRPLPPASSGSNSNSSSSHHTRTTTATAASTAGSRGPRPHPPGDRRDDTAAATTATGKSSNSKSSKNSSTTASNNTAPPPAPPPAPAAAGNSTTTATTTATSSGSTTNPLDLQHTLEFASGHVSDILISPQSSSSLSSNSTLDDDDDDDDSGHDDEDAYKDNISGGSNGGYGRIVARHKHGGGGGSSSSHGKTKSEHTARASPGLDGNGNHTAAATTTASGGGGANVRRGGGFRTTASSSPPPASSSSSAATAGRGQPVVVKFGGGGGKNKEKESAATKWPSHAARHASPTAGGGGVVAFAHDTMTITSDEDIAPAPVAGGKAAGAAAAGGGGGGHVTFSTFGGVSEQPSAGEPPPPPPPPAASHGSGGRGNLVATSLARAGDVSSLGGGGGGGGGNAAAVAETLSQHFHNNNNNNNNNNAMNGSNAMLGMSISMLDAAANYSKDTANAAVVRQRQQAAKRQRDAYFLRVPRMADVVADPALLYDVAHLNTFFLPGAPCSWLCCAAMALSFVTGMRVTIEQMLRVNRIGAHNIALPSITLAQMYDLVMDYIANRSQECVEEEEEEEEEQQADDDEQQDDVVAEKEQQQQQKEEGEEGRKAADAKNKSKSNNKTTTTTTTTATKAAALSPSEERRRLDAVCCHMATFDTDIVDADEALVDLRWAGEHAPITSLTQFRKELLAHVNEPGALYIFNYDPYTVEQYELRLRSNMAETDEEAAAIAAAGRHTPQNKGAFALLLDFSPVVHTVTLATPHLTRKRYRANNTTTATTAAEKAGKPPAGAAAAAASSSSATTTTAAVVDNTSFASLRERGASYGVNELHPFSADAVALLARKRGSVLSAATAMASGGGGGGAADASDACNDDDDNNNDKSNNKDDDKDDDGDDADMMDVVFEIHVIGLQTFYDAVRRTDTYTRLSRGFVRVYTTADSGSNDKTATTTAAAAASAIPRPPLAPTTPQRQLTTTTTPPAPSQQQRMRVVPSIFPLFVLDGSSSGGLLTSTLDVTLAPHIVGLAMVHHLVLTLLLSDTARRKQSSRNLLSRANVCDVKLRGVPLTKVCQQLHLPISAIVSQSSRSAIAAAYVWYHAFLQQLQIQHEVHLALVLPARRDDADDGQVNLSEDDFAAHLRLVVDSGSVLLIAFNPNIALNVYVDRQSAEPTHVGLVIGLDTARRVVRVADVNVKRFRKTWHVPLSRLYNATMGYGYMVACKDKKTARRLNGRAFEKYALACGRFALPPQTARAVTRFEYPARAYPITVLADAVARLGFASTVERVLNFSGYHITYFLSHNMPLAGLAAVAQNYSHYALDDALSVTTTHFDYFDGHLPLPRRRRGGRGSASRRRDDNNNNDDDDKQQQHHDDNDDDDDDDARECAPHIVYTAEHLRDQILRALAQPASRVLLVQYDHHVLASCEEVWNGSYGGEYAIVLEYDAHTQSVVLLDANASSFFRVFRCPLALLFRAVCTWHADGARMRGTLLLDKTRSQEALYDNTRGYDMAHALVHHPFHPIFSPTCACLALAATEMMMNVAVTTPFLGGGGGGGGGRSPLKTRANNSQGKQRSGSRAKAAAEEERRKYQRYHNIFSAEDFLYTVPGFSVHAWALSDVGEHTHEVVARANVSFAALRVPLCAVDLLARHVDALHSARELLRVCAGEGGVVTAVLVSYDTDVVHGVPGTSTGLVNRVRFYGEDDDDDDDDEDDDDEDNSHKNNNNDDDDDEDDDGDGTRPSSRQGSGRRGDRRARRRRPSIKDGVGSVQLLEGNLCRFGTYCECSATQLLRAVRSVIGIEVVDDEDDDGGDGDDVSYDM